MNGYYIEANGIWKGEHQLTWSELCSELNQLEEENEKLKDFIKKIATNNKIILANGSMYKIDKVIQND